MIIIDPHGHVCSQGRAHIWAIASASSAPVDHVWPKDPCRAHCKSGELSQSQHLTNETKSARF